MPAEYEALTRNATHDDPNLLDNVERECNLCGETVIISGSTANTLTRAAATGDTALFKCCCRLNIHSPEEYIKYTSGGADVHRHDFSVDKTCICGLTREELQKDLDSVSPDQAKLIVTVSCVPGGW